MELRQYELSRGLGTQKASLIGKTSVVRFVADGHSDCQRGLAGRDHHMGRLLGTGDVASEAEEPSLLVLSHLTAALHFQLDAKAVEDKSGDDRCFGVALLGCRFRLSIRASRLVGDTVNRLDFVVLR